MKPSFFHSLLIFLFLLFITGCKTQKEKTASVTPDYNPMISAFTGGVISVESPVRIRFTQPIADSVEMLSMLEKDIITLNPKVNGNTYYVDRKTIEFRPEKRFSQGTAYEVKVKLDRLFPVVANEKLFSFNFHTKEQHLTIALDGFRPYNDFKPVMNRLQGTVQTADIVFSEDIRKLLVAEQNNRKLPVNWNNQTDGKTHEFSIDSIVRGEKEMDVLIQFNGEAIHARQKGSLEFTVPALGDFKVISHQLVQYPEQHVVIRFSDPIRKNQSLDGLVRLSNDTDMRLLIEGNTIKAYPNVRQTGLLTLLVESGVRNILGKRLNEVKKIEILFEEINPAVEMLGNGVIIPSADRVLLPFKAVNLNAVDVRIVRIFENNIAQFLQVNRLDGSSELKRAGRLVLKKTISLVADKPINYGQWNTFSLDLTAMVETEAGAIYRVEINFREHQSLFPCGDGSAMDTEPFEEEGFDQINDEELTYWDAYEGYYSDWDYYDYEGYIWDHRNDPCKPAYYGKRRAATRNVLASNLGLIAKYGQEDKLHVTVTDLLTTGNISNARVTVYNFQQQVLDKGTTNGEGMVTLTPGAKPFLLVAEYGGQKGYLRLTDGSALSYSMFDVAGTSIYKGVKGFIYGERGVWRPGDSIFMNLVVDDRENPLPEGHPVTFQLKDPRGKMVCQRVSPINSTGFYTFHTKTAPDAPTGRYTLTAALGGVQFSKGLQVETIQPNRLKIDLSFEGDTIHPSRGEISAQLYGKWLTGATARNLKGMIEVAFSSSSTAFKGYEDYVFTDPAREADGQNRVFWEGSVDHTGNARFSKQLNISGKAPGMLQAVFTTRLFERSGSFSIDQQLVPCSPYDTYVGIKAPSGDKRNMLLTDTTHTFKVVTLSSSGTPVSRPGLDVKVYKLSWRWWWDASFENLASYMGNNYLTPVYNTTISTRRGKGSFDLKISYPEWGRFLVMVSDPGGHNAAKIVYVDWPGWAGRAAEGDPDAASVLTFSSDKSTYTVGETAVVTIPSSQKGRILLSLENGSGVLRQQWIETGSRETVFNLEITPEMTPNIYLYASLIQPYNNSGNDLPIRMFGVIPIRVEDPDTRLYPVIEMPEELKPGAEVELMVSERYHNEMTYTIAMVDEGLLNLTRFRTPDPWSAFYAKEALGVKTWDMFGQVLGAYGGRIDGIYNIGGGMDALVEGTRNANRFPPMVKFFGPYTLKNKKNIHMVKMPNYAGSVRTMVIAGNNGAYGNAEKTTPVRQPLMLLATLPRVLGPGEEVALPVNVFVMDEDIRRVDLEISTNDMLICSDRKKHVTFSGAGDKIVDFMLKTPEQTGVGKVKIVATSGRHRAEYEIELNVRSSNPLITNTMTRVVEPSSMFSEQFDLVGMSGTNDIVLEVSGIPPVDFGKRMKFLISYPHGCVEQVTSTLFPQLFLGDVIELTVPEKEQTEKHVKAGIARLTSFQLSEGGFSYWPGSSKVSSWGTSYAGHFIIEAKAKGYNVPGNMMRNWMNFQRKTARRWSPSGSSNRYEREQEQLMQAYRLFTLALAGEEEMGSMNRLRELTELVPEAKWRLAAAYALSGQKETAQELVLNIPAQGSDYHDSGLTFGSRIRDQAMMLEAMIFIGLEEQGVQLMENIAGALSDNRWMSTQTTAYSLVAVAKYTGGRKPSERLDFDYAFNKNEMKRAETGMPFAQLEFDPGQDIQGSVRLKNNTDAPLFLRFMNTGLPKQGEERDVNNNLELEVWYTDLEGKRISPDDIRQGSDFNAVYRVYNPGTSGTLDNVALTTLFPPGWEIHNERLFGTSDGRQMYTYQDVRDDRVMTYFSLSPGQAETFTIRLNAAYKGYYYLPAVKAEEMYLPDVQAVVSGKWIKTAAMN